MAKKRLHHKRRAPSKASCFCDLDQAKSAALNSLSFTEAQRGYPSRQVYAADRFMEIACAVEVVCLASYLFLVILLIDSVTGAR